MNLVHKSLQTCCHKPKKANMGVIGSGVPVRLAIGYQVNLRGQKEMHGSTLTTLHLPFPLSE